jgi:hypothetical protein
VTFFCNGVVLDPLPKLRLDFKQSAMIALQTSRNYMIYDKYVIVGNLLG